MQLTRFIAERFVYCPPDLRLVPLVCMPIVGMCVMAAQSIVYRMCALVEGMHILIWANGASNALRFVSPFYHSTGRAVAVSMCREMPSDDNCGNKGSGMIRGRETNKRIRGESGGLPWW